jgi:hypothetical protein
MSVNPGSNRMINSPAEFKGKSNRRCIGKITPESKRGAAKGLQLDIARKTKKLVGKSLYESKHFCQ